MNDLALIKIYSLRLLLLFCVCCCPKWALAEKFLPASQAFALSVQSLNSKQVRLSWKIAEGYYLYQHKLTLYQGDQAQKLDLPIAQHKHDRYFGDSKVYFNQLQFKVKVLPKQHYRLNYQGCAEKGLCYPLQQIEFTTDAEGLLPSDNHQQLQLALGAKPSAFDADTLDVVPINQASDSVLATNMSPVPADQHWSARLQHQSIWWSVLLFVALGCLLAFTPCSLPMLPILYGLLVGQRRRSGALIIGVVFVLSMATVYALLGLMAASLGSSFQRWLQQPWVLLGFSLLFVLFALNLFGCFEVALPQRFLSALSRWQSRISSGTVVGAGLMGLLTALLVGPCMTAPLAGTLLYISQSQNWVYGAVLLFSLGLGLGLPMLLLSVLGRRALPKPGPWMYLLKHLFGFLMLGLSLYFIRPLLSINQFGLALLLLASVLALYLLWQLIKAQNMPRYLSSVALLLLLMVTIWQVQQFWQARQQNTVQWLVVEDMAQFEAALQQAKQKQAPILIDVYATWCIACQPIEKHIWTKPEVQTALQSVTKIKLDLSHYQPSQQLILSQWQLLGPPTVLFLNKDAQELRPLRLTGEFDQAQLLSRIRQLRSP